MSRIGELKELKDMQAKHRKELAENREKLEARKKRTHRLIKRGAIAESFIGDIAKDMTDDEFYLALRKLCGMRGDS